MEAEGSLSYSRQPITCPYPEPHESSSHWHTLFFTIHFNIILRSTPVSQTAMSL